MGICLECLLQYERQRDEFLDYNVKGDESWYLYYDPEIKMHELAVETSIISLTKKVAHTQCW
jgi:hypothetical protein